MCFLYLNIRHKRKKFGTKGLFPASIWAIQSYVVKVKEIPPKEDLVMTNKELEVIVCNAIDARKEQGTPFDRDAFAALVKMAQALYPHTTYEHQIDVVARMKSIVDPIDGFHPRWETNELFDACIKAIEAKQPSYTIPYEDVVIFINSIKMALKRLDLKVDTCSCLSALAEKL